MNSSPLSTIVDSHCHFWDPTRFKYEWNHGLPALNRAFTPADIASATSDHRFKKFIFVECDCDAEQSLAEVDWVIGLAQQEKRLSGIVARASIEKGRAVRQELEQLVNRKLVKGIRRNLQGERDPDFALTADFVEGVKLLADFNYTFDLCIRHDQLASVAELARQVPQVTFILDHFGKPDVRRHSREPWRMDLQHFAGLPNTVCKVSGLTTEADWSHWQLDDLKFYFEQAHESFGFDRLLFGSDWPMATLATTFDNWTETVLKLFSFASGTELQQLFQGNAERVYHV